MRKQQRKITAIILTLALAMGQLTVSPVEAASKKYVSDKKKTNITIPEPTSTPNIMAPTEANDIPVPESISMPGVGEQTETPRAPRTTPGPIETVPPTGEGTIVHSGSYKKTKWKIYENGLLEVKGTGNMYPKIKFYEDDGVVPSTGPGWYNYGDKIKSARIEVKGATDLSYLFYWLDNLTSVDIRKLDTSKVTNMNSMFYNCRSLM